MTPDYDPPPGYDDGEVVDAPPGYFDDEYEESGFPDYKVYEGEYGSYNNYKKGSKDHIIAGFCHLLPVVGLLTIILKDELSPFLRFHAIQGFAFGFIAYFIAIIPLILLLCFGAVPIVIVLIITLIASVFCWIGRDFRYPFLANIIESKFI